MTTSPLRSRIEKRLREPGAIPLMTHLVCGYPSLEANWLMLEAMEAAGACLVEFQFPFSEPIADGPVFCRANQKALDAGTTTQQCFELMERASTSFRFVPLMMGYYNTAVAMGLPFFARRVAAGGGAGYILPDLPPEEAGPLHQAASMHGLEQVHLMTPTNDAARLKTIAQHSDSLVYAVARRGVTGAKTVFDADLVAFLKRCRESTQALVALGFGIKTPADVRSALKHADIAVIGTAFLEVYEARGATGAQEFLLELAAAAQKQPAHESLDLKLERC